MYMFAYCIYRLCNSLNICLHFVLIDCTDRTRPPNPCNSNPCRNGGRCVNNNENTAFECICPNGYEGDLCQERSNPCQPNPCENGGACTSSGFNRFNTLGYILVVLVILM